MMLAGWRNYMFSVRSSRAASFLLVALPFAAAPFGAPVYAQDNPTIVVEGKKPKEKKICTTIKPFTGSRIGSRRVCRTPTEVKTQQEYAQRAIEQKEQRDRAMDAYNENAKNGLSKQGPP
jgi:hypothetical protein